MGKHVSIPPRQPAALTHARTDACALLRTLRTFATLKWRPAKSSWAAKEN